MEKATLQLNRPFSSRQLYTVLPVVWARTEQGCWWQFCDLSVSGWPDGRRDLQAPQADLSIRVSSL